jgi:glutathione S-transferase
MSRGRIARWMLEEVGEPYRAEILEYAGSMKTPDYLMINPMGKVPTLRHGETIVTEAAAICAYLADVCAEAGLAPPPSSRLRGPYYRWLFFAAGPIEAANTNKTLSVVVPPERAGMVGYGSQERALGALENQLSRSEYIAGDRFTAADVYVGSQIGFGMMFGAIDQRPSFERYWELVRTRPAALRAREIDDKLAAAQRKAG